MRDRGFTLFELLVVLLIVGTMVGMATMAFRDNRGEVLEREARRLVTVLSVAADEATLKSRTLGVRVVGDEYAFYQRGPEGKGWQRLDGDRSLSPRTLPEPLRLQLITEGLDAKRPARQDQEKAEEPHLYLYSSGELTPAFEIVLSHPDLTGAYRIKGREDGRLEFDAPE